MSDQELPDGELLTLARAAAEVGWKGSSKARRVRMRRLLEAKERGAGRPIMTRNGEPPAPLLVTRGALRRHCPELFETGVDVLARGFRGILQELDSKLDRRIEEHPKIQALDRRTRVLRKDLNELAERIVKVV